MSLPWPASALTRVPRPVPIAVCAGCGRDRPAGYADCGRCRAFLDAWWVADWAALLEREAVAPGGEDERLLAEVVLGEWERHPFTVLDVAMTLLTCPDCGRELGSTYGDCWPCKEAFGHALAAEGNGITRLDHAWHIGRWVVRHPDQHSAASVAGWSAHLPRLLAGDLPTTAEAQRGARDLKRALARDPG